MREEAQKRIEELTDRFRRNVDVYKNGTYNETQVRREFIDPFFEALGWDVANRAGYAEQHKDVVHEDSIKVGVSLKAPDYSLPGKFWQRNYHEDVIRNEEELNHIREYIIYNPARWAEDENNPLNIK